MFSFLSRFLKKTVVVEKEDFVDLLIEKIKEARNICLNRYGRAEWTYIDDDWRVKQFVSVDNGKIITHWITAYYKGALILAADISNEIKVFDKSFNLNMDKFKEELCQILN